MKRILHSVLCLLLLFGCSSGNGNAPIKDGIYFKFELYSPGPTAYQEYWTYTFHKLPGNKFQLIKEGEGSRYASYVRPDLRDFQEPIRLGRTPGPVGGFLWIPPKRLKEDTLEGWRVLGEGTKNGYQVYRITDTGYGNIGYHEKTTGFQVAFDNIHSRTKVYSRLLDSNAGGLRVARTGIY